MPKLIPCNHAFCYKCARALRTCALCRAVIEGRKFDENSFAVALETMELQDVDLYLKKASSKFIEITFDLLVLHNNIKDIWTKSHYNQMVIMTRTYSHYASDLLVSVWANPDMRIVQLRNMARYASDHEVFKFILDNVDMGKKFKKQIHLTRTIFMDGDVRMNAIQYAVNALILSLETLCRMFPRMLVLIAAQSLRTCADKQNYHKEFEKIQDTMTYHELLVALNMQNYIFDKELERAFSYVKHRARGTTREELVGEYVNSVDVIFEKLVQYKYCRIVDNKIFYP
ncbi:MAG: hypothetical protein K2Q45_07080 [Nitrosomonas sp.]|nr:hypothetical protein [Nitrosomonas sp.]